MVAEYEDEYDCETRCLKCGKTWTDVYAVVDVREHVEEQEEWEEPEAETTT